MEKTINIEVSKRGLPCIWESGGGYSNTGHSTIVSDSLGQPKKAIYLPRCYCCGQHALIPVRINDLIIKASRHGNEYDIYIYTVQSINKETKEAMIELVNKYDRGEWDSPLSEALEAAVKAAKRKSACYHCRCRHYIKEE